MAAEKTGCRPVEAGQAAAEDRTRRGCLHELVRAHGVRGSRRGRRSICRSRRAFLKSWILAHYNERLLALWQEERPATHRVEILRARHDPQPKAAPRAEKAADGRRRSPVPAALSRAGRVKRARRARGAARRLAGRSALHLRDLLRRRGQPGRLRRGPCRRRDADGQGRASSTRSTSMPASAAARRISSMPPRARRGGPIPAARWST